MPFDFQPTFKGALVELRPLRPDDADDLFAVASDLLIWEQHLIRDRYKPDVFSTFFLESLTSRGALAVLDCKDGRIIGSSRFHAYNAQAREVEIGWTFLARSHWGRKYNREIKQLMLRHAFRFVTFAKGDRETREHSCRLKARHRRKRLLRVRNHIRARLSYGWAEVLDAEPHLSSEALRPHREEDPKARTPEGGAVDGMAHRRSGRAPAPGEVAPDPDVAHSALSDRSDDLPSCDCSI